MTARRNRRIGIGLTLIGVALLIAALGFVLAGIWSSGEVVSRLENTAAALGFPGLPLVLIGGMTWMENS